MLRHDTDSDTGCTSAGSLAWSPPGLLTGWWQDTCVFFACLLSEQTNRNSSEARYTHNEDRHHIAYSAYLFTSFVEPILSMAIPRPGRPICNIEQKTQNFTNSYGFVY
jgi:hypothetical protein